MLIDFIKNFSIQILIVSILSYLIGSISFPIIVTKIFNKNQDIRTMGSGNAGFTNVLRSVGTIPAILTFAGDFFKCIVAIIIAKYIFSFGSFNQLPSFYINQYAAYISGMFCAIGHIYPCFFNFRGGKSIVASFSMIVATHWQIGVIVLSIFFLVLFLSKIVSLSSIVSAITYPFVNFLSIKFLIFNNTSNNFLNDYLLFTTCISIIVMIIVIYKHKSNIKRLLNGTEKKITTAKHK